MARLIKKELPTSNFSRIDNDVIVILSGDALKLYAILVRTKASTDIKDSYLMQVMSMSQASITRLKSELKSVGLLLIERTGMMQYEMTLKHLPTKKVRRKKKNANVHS